MTPWPVRRECPVERGGPVWPEQISASTSAIATAAVSTPPATLRDTTIHRGSRLCDDRGVIKAVIFDIDGVVVYPWGFRNLLAREYNITPAMTAGFFTGPFIDCVEGRVDVVDALPPYLAEWGWPGDVASFIDRWHTAEHTLNHEVVAIVRALRERGLPCFAASVQERRRAGYLAREMGFATLFDGLFFSCDLGARKPQPAFYAAVTSRLAHRPGELLFFDDMPAFVDAAREAGWTAELFTSVDQLRADVTRHTNSPTDPLTN
jgi:putative hydrolase of the HAD superfamily